MHKICYPLFGIVSVLNTPFTSRNKVDFPALKNNIAHALKAGVSGFLVPALAAEVSKLTKAEKMGMVEAVCEAVNGVVPVFAATGPVPLADAKVIVRAYSSLGCKNMMFQIPFTEKEQFLAHFYSLAALEVDTIMLQDWCATGYGLDDELIVNLFEQVPHFRCLKVETVPSGPKYSRLLDLTKGRLNLSGGWAVMQLIEGLERGVHAFMPTGMHWIYTEIFNAFQSGNTEKATYFFRKILPVLAFSNQHLDISIHFFKRLLHQQGIYPTDHVRQLSISFDVTHERIADSLIQEVLVLEEEIRCNRVSKLS